ncbi:MAG: GHKL domain-containing protein [Clostridia bacterium]|nr:GHKL domain-containing protein [Clostridia bacterium]
MRNIRIFKSIRNKLFISLCIIVLLIISFLIILNNFVLGRFYLYNKKKNLKMAYSIINEFYNNRDSHDDIEAELDRISAKNDFDILIKDEYNQSIYISSKDFFAGLIQMNMMTTRSSLEKNNLLEKNEKYTISEIKDESTNIKYIIFVSNLDNGYKIYIRMPMASIEESVKISNKFLYYIAIFVIVFGGIVLSIVSRRFSEPIEELDDIAKKMANLDFSQKYNISQANDEIDNLGRSINKLSDKLESTIKQLKSTNLELEKDVEEKSQIDEMRKSFISDVSHELKTPIALIQGYSEGLIENVNSDEESRKFYAEVILDEATKMDKLVKQLLELMKLEYGKKNFNNSNFNIIELEKEIIRKSEVMIQKENIKVEMPEKTEIEVYADEFYTDQVITNYITNAIKYCNEINNVKKIKISNEIIGDKVRITIFNTSKGLSEEELVHIWNRFYKIDESRNRDNGGTGIGLSLVKAIMNNYGNEYGAKNVEGGIEFYFDLDTIKS